MFHSIFSCRSSRTVSIAYFPQGSVCWMFSRKKKIMFGYFVVVVRSWNKENKTWIKLLWFFWGQKCLLNTQIVSLSLVLIFHWKHVLEEKEDFNKAYKTFVFLNFLAVAIFPSLFLQNLVMSNLSQTVPPSPLADPCFGRFLWQELWRGGIPRVVVALAWQVQVLKSGWDEKGSPDLSADTWGLAGHDGENKNPAHRKHPGCPGWMFSEYLGVHGCICVLVSVLWEQRGQSQTRLGGFCSIGLSPAQALLPWLCPSSRAEHPSAP